MTKLSDSFLIYIISTFPDSKIFEVSQSVGDHVSTPLESNATSMPFNALCKVTVAPDMTRATKVSEAKKNVMCVCLYVCACDDL